MISNYFKSVLILLLFCVSSVYAQRTITGTVVDSNSKEPIIGATIVTTGSNAGTVTDIDGKFSLHINTIDKDIRVSYIGYRTQTISAENKNNFLIELEEETLELDQVVVIGYGVQKKSDLTGAVSSIKSEDLGRIPSANVAQALQGKAAGVEVVQNSGSPGAGTSIRIRGTGTVNNSDPLYIVDGMAVENINYLSSDDIASMEILKDAASSAIYGSRAANGVVLITTKSGKEGRKANVTLNTFVGWQEAWKNPKLMNKEEYVFFSDYARNIYSKTELDPTTGNLRIKEETRPEIEGGSNWWDEITQKGLMQKYNLSVDGGSNKMNYYVSGSYNRIEGIVKESDYQRASFVAKLNADLSEKVELGANINYANEKRSVVDEGGMWGVIKQSMADSPLMQLKTPTDDYTWSTPVEILRRTTFDAKNDNLIAQMTLDWEIVKNLKFTSRAGYFYSGRNEDHFERSNLNPEMVGDVVYKVIRKPMSTQNISWDNILNYSLNIADIHDFQFMIGQTFENNVYEETYGYGEGYGGNADNYDALDFGIFSQKASGYTSSWRTLGFLGRISYNYKDKYLLQANFRADGSSRFTDHWGYFPSVSVGWKLTGEEFMQSVGWISLLKIRAGWGQLGNNRIGDNAFGTYVSPRYNNTRYNYIYGKTDPRFKPGMTITQYGNEDISWERTQSVNIGVDFNLFNNRLSTNIDWFTKETKDMLLVVPIVYSTGMIDIPIQNAGSVNNKGYEIQVNWKDKIGDFSYEIGGNFTQVKNKVTSLGEKNEPIYGGGVDVLGDLNKTVGGPIGAFYGWKTAGIIQEGEDVSGLATFKSDKPFVPGDMKFVDVNKDGVIDDNDRVFLGSPHPDFYYGFNINLAYKNFDLFMFFQGIHGNDIYNAMNLYKYSNRQWQGMTSNVASDYMDKVWRGNSNDYRGNWTPNPSGKFPAPSTDLARNDINFKNSDLYIEDGSYLRLKNIQLGYNLPQATCQRLGIKSLRIYAAATNLFTITKYTGMDPEIGKTNGQESNNLYLGIDEGIYPQTRSYTFGLIFNF